MMNSTSEIGSATGNGLAGRRRFDRALVLGTFVIIGAAALPIGCGGKSEGNEQSSAGSAGKGPAPQGDAKQYPGDGHPFVDGSQGDGGPVGGRGGAGGGAPGGGTSNVGGRPFAVDGSSFHGDGSSFHGDGSGFHGDGRPGQGDGYRGDGTIYSDGDPGGDGEPYFADGSDGDPYSGDGAVLDGSADGFSGGGRGSGSADGAPDPGFGDGAPDA
jgi:hypothetical protein